MPPAMEITAGTSSLLDSLRNLRRRVKLWSVLYGFGLVLASAVVLLLTVVMLDYKLNLHAVPRIIVNLAALGVLGYTLWRWCILPAFEKLSLSDLAGRIENTFPQFDDSLRSTVTFSNTVVPGSEIMKARTVERANQLAKEVDLNQAVVLKPVWSSLSIGLASVLGFIAIVLVMDPNIRAIAANRLFAGSTQWPKSNQIELIGDMPTRVPAGQDVVINLKDNKGKASKATIRHRFDNGAWQTETVEAGKDGTFAIRIPAVLEGNRDLGKLQIQVEAGDDQRDLLPVAIVPPLEIRGAVAMVRPPAYTKLEPFPINAAERPITAAYGSEIEFQLTFNKALDSAKKLRIQSATAGRAMPQFTPAFPRNGVATATFAIGNAFKEGEPLKFIVHATDTDGFENQTAPEYTLVVRADSLPSISIEIPHQTEDRTPDATIPMRGIAEDDYGFDSVELIVEGKSPSLANRNWVLPLVKNDVASARASWQVASNSTPERRRFVVEYQWDLTKLENVTLKPGDRLEYYLRARDNYDLNGERHKPVDSSPRLQINIISHDQFDAWVENVLSSVRQEIGSIKKTVEVTKSGAEQQAKETADRGKLDDAQRETMARLANQQSTANSQTKDTAKKLNDLVQRMAENKAPEEGAKTSATKVAEQLQQTADSPMKQASNKLNEAKDTKSDPKASADQKKQDAAKAAESLKNAAKDQQAAADQLEKAMNQLNDFGGLAPAIQNIEKIKKEQEKVAKDYKEKMKDALGKKADEMTDKQKDDLKKLAEKQDALAKETADALKQMSEKSDKMAKSDPQSAKAMKEAAQTGQQQGIPQKQSNPKDDDGASQKMQQNQQANAQQKHKEIELGLEMILEKLKAAERAKLELLQKELAELQALINDLVVRQSGHNIDNLLLQDKNGKKLLELSEADRNALFEQATRDIKEWSKLKPDLEALKPSQEQTHRNTVAIARKAEALQDPTPAGKLNAAATKMEQAVVYLRKGELVDAYQPPQALALVYLVEAKKLIDEAKKKADQEMNERKEESIKQAYVKLLESQKKLDEETKDIEKNGKDADGNLKRTASVRLAAMPGEQGKLAEDASKLGEKLAAIKSIVYVWANKDIVNSMGEVKEDLAKPRTDLVVQTQQTRIEEQLEAMIRNLAQKKDPKEFEQRAGGGGGGGGGGKKPPKMPTDVELRLLRDLQIAVNKATTIIDAEVKKAEGKKDAQKLLSLGGRQGELRNLLDQLLQAASEGKVALGPEPKDAEKLPEEAGKDDIEQQEFVKGLIEDKLNADTVEKTVKLIGDRMGRSRQRLALDNDPGKTTQEIQKRINLDLENLIKLAQAQQQQSGPPKPGEGQGDKPGQPKPGEGQGQQQANQQGKQPGQQSNGGEQAATDSNPGGALDKQDVSKELREKLAGWGAITQRDRLPVMEGAGEKNAPKYDKYIADYYKDLAKKASEK